MTDWQSLGVVEGEDGKRRCGWCTSAPEYVSYHDDEWGRPVVDDVRLSEKLCLEFVAATTKDASKPTTSSTPPAADPPKTPI